MWFSSRACAALGSSKMLTLGDRSLRSTAAREAPCYCCSSDYRVVETHEVVSLRLKCGVSRMLEAAHSAERRNAWHLAPGSFRVGCLL
jgi:hypothetical protein